MGFPAVQAKQKESGWDIDARLLMYADAIKRTEQRVFTAAASAAAEKESPVAKDDISVSKPRTVELDHGFPQLHIKTTCAACLQYK